MTRLLILLMAAVCAATSSVMLSAQSADRSFDPEVMQAVQEELQYADQPLEPEVIRAVQNTFPKDLIYTPTQRRPSRRPYHACAAVFSRMADGTPDLIAAGYDGNGSVIAMLAYSSGAAYILDSVTHEQLFLLGGPCDASIVNLGNPSQPESPLSQVINISHGGSNWFFLWNGAELVNITALDNNPARKNRPPMTDMYIFDFVDLDRSGPLQVMCRNGDYENFPGDDGVKAIGTWTLFRYNGETFAPGDTFQYFYEYSSEWKGPWSQKAGYHELRESGYHLTVVNGDRDGSN